MGGGRDTGRRRRRPAVDRTGGGTPCARVASLLVIVPGLATAVAPARAAELGSLDGFDVRLDTTLRGSLGLRLEASDPALLADRNADDGDRAFVPGINSERVDMAAQLDVTKGDFGADLGTDGWYDQVYHVADANRSPATFNPLSVSNEAFPSATTNLLGGTVELQDAFVHDRFELAGAPVTVRVGRQTLLWGESLFFPQDGIAGGQAPVDEIKELSQPLVESQEVYLPVTQADVRVQLPDRLSLEAYEQVEWRRDRTPGVGSYFSTGDVLDAGGERIFGPDGTALLRGRDIEPSGTGQFGLALRYGSGSLDLGLYGLRFDAKDPELIRSISQPGAYQATFPRGVYLVGVSASTYLGASTLAGEISERWRMPLVSVGLPAVPVGSGALPLSASSEVGPALPSAYPTGRTLQALVSFDSQLRPARWWGAATIDAEIVATDLLGIDDNPALRLPSTTHLASAAELVFTPAYFQVLRNLDVTVPVGVQVGLGGRSSVDPGQVAGTGSVTVSVTAVYRTVWEGGASFTHFIGPASEQALADRDFLVLSLSRTF